MFLPMIKLFNLKLNGVIKFEKYMITYIIRYDNLVLFCQQVDKDIINVTLRKYYLIAILIFLLKLFLF